MKKKFVLDVLIFLLGSAIALIGHFYMEGSYRRGFTLLGCGIMIWFLWLALRDRKDPTSQITAPLPTSTYPPKAEITEAVLLSEEGTHLASWPLYGKTSMVIGRDQGENQVNINLSSSTYASMIEVEHAVLNYSAGSWYVEDLASKNGVMVQKQADGRKYKLASGQPCKLSGGDIIYVGLTKLLLR